MQVAGTNVHFDWLDSSPSKGSIDFLYIFPAPRGEAGYCYRAILSRTLTRGELFGIIGKTVEDPDGVLCRIKNLTDYPDGRPYSGDLVMLHLEPLEKPF